ncbi:MAG: glucose 1-dehydrogenase [Anaerolineaceae bacterium]|nr:glucose 1-dehydrogenase [Anaerolineaceae bacterium]
MYSIGNVKNIFSLEDKVVLVTGGGQGLGQAMAEGFSQFGAVVSIVDINLENAQSVADTIIADGGKAIAIKCDVSKEYQVKAAVEKTIKELGKIDSLSAVAGIGDRNPAEEMTMGQWDRVIAINLRGVWLFDQEVGRHMIARGEGGSIINMASIAGQVGLTTGNANYSASKGGVIALTRDLAIEWAKYNIRSNAIAPAQFKTPLIQKLIQNPETEAYFLRNIPLNRIGEVWEIVGASVFLASDASSMVTGIVLNVDGGHTAK